MYRSTDGGATFQKVLSKDENTGASDLEFDPKNPDIVYACLWEQRQGPWENGAWAGTDGGIFKSTDGGTTWRQLTQGPAGRRRSCRPTSRSRQATATGSTRRSPTRSTVRIYRSDDAGENWTQITTDNRPAGRIGGGDLPVPAVDPKNARHRDHREHGQLSIEGRRQDLDGAARRARRRRLPASVDQPGELEHHRAGERPGRDRQRQRRRDVELLVQPADLADVSRQRRQRVSLPRLRRPAGERIGVRRRAAATTG